MAIAHNTTLESLAADVAVLARKWADERRERQLRRSLDPADFDALRAAGFHLTAVPKELGGLWRTTPESTRAVCAVLRTIAHADPSLALVCSMHPAVLVTSAEARRVDTHHPGWEEQRRWMFQTVLEGALWGPIVSEPGSGGDTSKTRSTAKLLADGSYAMSGLKHFGTGSGVTSFATTTAVPDGESEQVSFFMDMRRVPWDGSTGVRLVAAWDGHGMTATQSHAFEFVDFPATRLLRIGRPDNLFPACSWAAVTVGILESAMAAARRSLAGRSDNLRPFEAVEWTNAELGAFLVDAAYEAMVRGVEQAGSDWQLRVMQGKATIAEQAEQVLTRLCRVIGGGTFGRQSPFGFWLEDVRALGFLRPPWGLAYDNLGKEQAQVFREGESQV